MSFNDSQDEEPSIQISKWLLLTAKPGPEVLAPRRGKTVLILSRCQEKYLFTHLRANVTSCLLWPTTLATSEVFR